MTCETQAEVDEFWEKLSEGGQEGPCGWVTDKFGVSWQVVPRVLGDLLDDEDADKANNVLNAMLQMSKLDITTLQKAHDG